MKRRMVVISALIIGIGCCSPGASAEASQNKKDSVKTEDQLEENIFEKNYLLGKNLASGIDEIKLKDNYNFLITDQENAMESDIDWFDYENLDSAEADLNPREEDEADKKNREGKTSEMKDLQIPQKLDVVIDPWGMDGKEQIYSEEYSIKNTGEMAGILTLSRLTCKPQEKSSTVVKMDKKGLHDNGEKAVYMEMIFENDDRVILSEVDAEYQVNLEPGEELNFRFAGEVNEYAEDKWTNEDIKVDIVYSWSVETKTHDMDGENVDEINASDDSANVNESTTKDAADLNRDTVEDTDDINSKGNVASDVEVAGRKESDNTGKEIEVDEGSQDAADLESEVTDNDDTLPWIEEFSYEQDIDENEDEKIERIDLQKMKKSKLMIDSWTKNEEIQDEESNQDDKDDQSEQEKQGIKIVSSEYVLRNTGETVGTLILSGLTCKTQEWNGITVMENQEELKHSAGGTVYIEMLTRVGEVEEKKALSQEDSEYQIELEPGEEISIRFAGEMKERSDEDWKNENVEVTAVCLWRS